MYMMDDDDAVFNCDYVDIHSSKHVAPKILGAAGAFIAGA
jgi:hypothetical protein